MVTGNAASLLIKRDMRHCTIGMRPNFDSFTCAISHVLKNYSFGDAVLPVSFLSVFLDAATDAVNNAINNVANDVAEGIAGA